ncbi:phosphatase 2C-like domain-containing protein [Cadophora sp. MPI-SDFR-AT-0126]|nr:phosphatase 2C-like domain-containing protein [Leotiomycetes sp. MPI-SDFR-AT-0126]
MAGMKTGRRPWSLRDTYDFIATYLHKTDAGPIYPSISSRFRRQYTTSQCRTAHINRIRTHRPHLPVSKSRNAHPSQKIVLGSRYFHDYFVTNLPSSSLHPDSKSSTGPHHKLPRAASTPHTPGNGPSPAAAPPMVGMSREMTVVRIPLRSAKHHFGVSVSRGTRAYNEDTYQAGTLEIPAFAKRAPISLSRAGKTASATSADSASGDPQVFYFGVFDGHGGNECSDFLREELHGYLERTADTFELASSLKTGKKKGSNVGGLSAEKGGAIELASKGGESLQKIETKSGRDVEQQSNIPMKGKDGRIEQPPASPAIESDGPVSIESNKPKTIELERSLVAQWKETVGGYFRRFRPEYFSLPASSGEESAVETPVSIETVLMYAFLKADLDFVTAQAQKPDPENHSDKPLNADDILGQPAHLSSQHRIGGPTRFVGGSTASIVLISTPTPTPFWHPASPSTIVVAHVGDTRILLCNTATGLAIPATTNHHPSSPVEGARLRRYAATFVTDSFGEERMSGLANTRAFGDMRSKRIGVSAEPEIRRVELAPAEYSFLVLVSDGVSGTLTDQEIVDVVKEAKTPEQGARDVVSFATEVSREGDNATCLVVRLGGWERRIEGGMGSMGTKEVRDFRKGDALDPRRGRT